MIPWYQRLGGACCGVRAGSRVGCVYGMSHYRHRVGDCGPGWFGVGLRRTVLWGYMPVYRLEPGGEL